MVGEGSPFWFSLNCSCQTDNNHFKCYILIFHITNFFEFFMTRSRVTCTISLFFLEKKSEIWNAFTFFENWKVNLVFLSLISRMKSEMKIPWDRDREWKVKWKCLEIEIEKWNVDKILENSRETRLSQVTAKSDGLLYSVSVSAMMIFSPKFIQPMSARVMLITSSQWFWKTMTSHQLIVFQVKMFLIKVKSYWCLSWSSDTI